MADPAPKGRQQPIVSFLVQWMLRNSLYERCIDQTIFPFEFSMELYRSGSSVKCVNALLSSCILEISPNLYRKAPRSLGSTYAFPSTAGISLASLPLIKLSSRILWCSSDVDTL